MDLAAIFTGVAAILTAAGGVVLVVREFRRRDRRDSQRDIDELEPDLHDSALRTSPTSEGGPSSCTSRRWTLVWMSPNHPLPARWHRRILMGFVWAVILFAVAGGLTMATVAQATSDDATDNDHHFACSGRGPGWSR